FTTTEYVLNKSRSTILVLRKAEVSDPTRSRSKVAPNWEGPYRIEGIAREGTYTLVTKEGKQLPRT
ncbi:hypothetical protein BHE74_00020755, partial [Ensete ventricosum]